MRFLCSDSQYFPQLGELKFNFQDTQKLDQIHLLIMIILIPKCFKNSKKNGKWHNWWYLVIVSRKNHVWKTYKTLRTKYKTWFPLIIWKQKQSIKTFDTALSKKKNKKPANWPVIVDDVIVVSYFERFIKTSKLCEEFQL